MNLQEHWDRIYQSKKPTQVSWYQEHARLSLEFIRRTEVDRQAQIIDVGGGTSPLVDDLLSDGFKHVTVLDISGEALRAAQDRLGERAREVTWIEADVTQAGLPEHTYDLWHDRATFHFLTNSDQRLKYVSMVRRALKPGGHVIVATFALDGPSECSGLNVMQYSPQSLHNEFDGGFELVDSARESHITPFGKEQRFIYCYCRKLAEPVLAPAA